MALLGAAGVLVGAAAGQAQTPPQRIRGTIAGFEGHVLSIKTREGPVIAVTLPDNPAVSTVKPVELASIAPGSYIGTAASPGPDGALVALEVLVFPEAARGSGEGHYDWDLAPGSSMTNATVSAAVQANSGRELSLAYKGGSVVVRVPPGVPVVTIAPAAVSDLKTGAPVFLAATKAADGTLGAGRVTVGTNGVAPPM